MKKTVGILLIILSMVFFLKTPTLTGNVIGTSDTIKINFWLILNLATLIFGLLILTSRKTLDAIIILGSPSEEESEDRTNLALEEKADVYIATGGNTTSLNPKFSSEAEMIYKRLRKGGISPRNIRVEKSSKDTTGNLIYALKKVKGKEIGIVSTPSHLNRVGRIISVGKRDGTFDKDLRIHRIETGETWRNKVYELFIGIFAPYKLKRGKLIPNEYDGPFKKFLNDLTKTFK